ncbi:MAG: BlaI/MecI/CopY family transcriptional regulator [Planctomycetota bacterium]|jgi:BlaI family penicillinase repressor
MKKIPRIPNAEWQVAEVLWEEAPRTASEIAAVLSHKTSWSPKTVRTLLNRLVRRGVVRFKKEGRQHCYFPVLCREECVKAQARSFLSGFSPAALRPILAAFLEHQEMSAEDIEALKRLLEEKQRK